MDSTNGSLQSAHKHTSRTHLSDSGESRPEYERDDERDDEGDVVEEVVEPRLHRTHSQLLLPRRPDRHDLLAKPRVHVVKHLDAENLKEDTMKVSS